MNDKLTIKVAGSTESCRVCLARNYDSAMKPEIGKRVDKLYEVHIGALTPVLCEECLADLGGLLCAKVLEIADEALYEEARPP